MLQLVASVDDNSIRVWDTRTCDQMYELRQHKGLAFVLECHPTDSRIGMWGAYDGVVHMFDLATGGELSRCGHIHLRRLTPCWVAGRCRAVAHRIDVDAVRQAAQSLSKRRIHMCMHLTHSACILISAAAPMLRWICC